MKGRFIYYIFVTCLFSAQFSAAVATQCPDIPDPDECKNTAGCAYDTLIGECGYCAGGHYCPNNGCSNDTGACNCPAPFSSSFAGAAQIGECFAEMTCNNDSTHPNVIAGISYTTDGTYFIAPIVNNNFWDFNDPNHTWPASNPNVFFDLFHLEITGSGADTTFACESNTNTCDQFTYDAVSACTALSSHAVNWVDDSNGGYWNVSDCKCDKDTAEIPNKNCTGPQQLAAVENQTGVTHVGDPIVFNQNIEGYYCNSCIADSGNDIYYADIDATASNCNKNVSQGKVCKCIKLTEKGFYRSGDCGANQNWGSQSDICLKQACPLPGQTTLTLGPTDPDDCQYTDQTQFCDAKGCFTLSTTELSAWGLTN